MRRSAFPPLYQFNAFLDSLVFAILAGENQYFLFNYYKIWPTYNYVEWLECWIPIIQYVDFKDFYLFVIVLLWKTEWWPPKDICGLVPEIFDYDDML